MLSLLHHLQPDVDEGRTLNQLHKRAKLNELLGVQLLSELEQQVIGQLILLGQETQNDGADRVETPRVVKVDEQLFFILGEVCRHRPKQFGSQSFVKGRRSNGKGHRFNHVLHER